jgi:peroxiredoxin Q/BCP
MYGKKVTGCIRSTFLVRNGRVVKVFPSVKVDGHAEEVLQAIGELNHGPSSKRIPTLPPPSSKTERRAPAKKAKAVKKAVKKVVKKVAAKVKKAVAKKKTRTAKRAPGKK